MAARRGHRPRLFPAFPPMGTFPAAMASLRLLLAVLDPGITTGGRRRPHGPLPFRCRVGASCFNVEPPRLTIPLDHIHNPFAINLCLANVTWTPPGHGFAQGLLGHHPWLYSVRDGDGAAVVLAWLTWDENRYCLLMGVVEIACIHATQVCATTHDHERYSGLSRDIRSPPLHSHRLLLLSFSSSNRLIPAAFHSHTLFRFSAHFFHLNTSLIEVHYLYDLKSISTLSTNENYIQQHQTQHFWKICKNAFLQELRCPFRHCRRRLCHGPRSRQLLHRWL